jgi:Reverse transcriptase (RNA-dependent DNA polymerase)/RNase H-like domain found in reverse transcriptase
VVIPSKLYSQSDRAPILCNAMLDSGSSGFAFVDLDYAHKNKLQRIPLHTPKDIRMFDGTEPRSGRITHCVRVELEMDNHREWMFMFITALSGYPVILGIPWLRRHNPHVDWALSTLTLNSSYCRWNCLLGRRPARVLGAPDEGQELEQETGRELDQEQEQEPDQELGREPVRESDRELEPDRELNREPDRELDQEPDRELDRELDREPDRELDRGPDRESGRKLDREQETEARLDIRCISGAAYMQHTKRKDHFLGRFTLEDIEKTLEKLEKKSTTNPHDVVPHEYHEFLDVFSQELADRLPPRRPQDHKIELVPGKTPPSSPLLQMSHDELRVLRKWLDENLRKGFIRPSSSSAAAPVLFARKPQGGLRLCVDYRGLNAITKKNKYPIPLIRETLAMVTRAKIFTKLDVIAAFNRLRIAEGHEPLTAFRTRWGLFESLVMPFGLTNAPASWQSFINETFKDFLDKFVTAYLDDLLIFSDSLKEHREHVKAVLGRLRDAGLQIDVDKCEFHVQRVNYLGLIVGVDGISMDPKKVSVILEWTTPSCVKDVQAFLGFANFYRRFIRGFAKVAMPLNRLTRKGQRFKWTPECQTAFESLKLMFTTAPVLKNFEWDKECVVECDSSDYVVGGVLSV